MIQAKMHDGNRIEIDVAGEGPSLLLPVNTQKIEGAQAEEMMKWGVDPALGRSFVDGLRDSYRVIAFDYEGHVFKHAKPDTLTPANIAADFIAIANTAEADTFAYYGYSWLALSGMQLAIRTNRLSGLIMGGYPPIDGPYEAMLAVTQATYDMSLTPKTTSNVKTAEPWGGSPDDVDWSQVEVTMNAEQTRQFVTLYESLRTFDDRAAQSLIACPKLCFAGTADKIAYSPKWGGVLVDIISPLIDRRHELEAYGWDVAVLEGLDHTQAMQASNVLPILRPWLDRNVSV
ncbi:alpha/beta fold hydrolase [Paenibacillus guangzhouensis]|uniref:alpha/beta fold hydrolase n=1 Tax=Paenibacillus guangzhouensis TaxID=1473112 RepID=UPI0012677688|nr:alpha/beta hydrolase [Paenibacillus guangzhouensis]